MEIRDLFGMNYKSVELTHDVATPAHKVLKELAKYFKENDIHGIIQHLSTQSSEFDEDTFLTTVIYSV